MQYLVTGGAGFIGSNLVDRLLKDGHRVIVIDNFYFNYKNLDSYLANKSLTVYRRSVCEDLKDIFQNKIDAVFHLGALPRVQFSIKNPIETHNANVNGTLNLLEHCKEFDVKRFVFSSSSSIYGDQKTLPLEESMVPNPLSPYALHKLIGEMYCMMYKFLYQLETISLRYFNVYGPRQDPGGEYACLIPKFIKNFAEGISPTINGNGEQTRDFTFVSDVVEANLSAAKTSNREAFGLAFNVGCGRNISVNKVTEEIIKLTKSTVKPIYGPTVIEPKNTLADISRINEYLGWKPRVSFEEGLRSTYEYFMGSAKI